MPASTLQDTCVRLTTPAAVALANGTVVRAAIAALDDDNTTAQALYETAAGLFRQAGEAGEAARIEALAADCAEALADAAGAPALPVAA